MRLGINFKKVLQFLSLPATFIVFAAMLLACSDSNATKASPTTVASAVQAATTAAASATTASAAVTATSASAAVTSSTAVSTTAPYKPNPSNGSMIVRRSCSVCHANAGRDVGTNKEPSLAKSTLTDDPAKIKDRLKNGYKGVISSGMPAFVALTDNEVEDIIAYIQEIKKPAGFADVLPTPRPTVAPVTITVTPAPTATPPVTKDPVITGSAARGETLFRQNCNRCHANMGRNGGIDNGYGYAVPNLSLWKSGWDADAVRNFIFLGSPLGPTRMPAFGPILTSQELEDLVAWVNVINTYLKPKP